MIILINIKDLEYDETREHMNNGLLPSANEYLILKKILASPPHIYPYSLFPILNGMYQSQAINKKHKLNSINKFDNSIMLSPNKYDVYKSILLREALYSDRKLWERTENILKQQKHQFLSLTLNAFEISNKIYKSNSIVKYRTTILTFIDYIIHRINFIIGKYGTHKIILVGIGKSPDKGYNIKFINQISKSYEAKIRIKSSLPGITLLEIPKNSNIKNINSALKEAALENDIDTIANKTPTGFTIDFVNGNSDINTEKNEHILEINNTGDTPLNKIPHRLTRSEIFQFTKDNEYPMILKHIELLFNKTNATTILAKNIFKKEWLTQPVLINNKWSNIKESKDLFEEINIRNQFEHLPLFGMHV